MERQSGSKKQADGYLSYGVYQAFSLTCPAPRFVKVRYYGYLSNRERTRNVEKCIGLITIKKRILSSPASEKKDSDNAGETENEHNEKVCLKCEYCSGIMSVRKIIPRVRHGPF